MAVNFTLTTRVERDPEDDPLGRSWTGWDRTRSDDELWAANRGRWRLGPRWQRERFATLSYRGVIEVVVELDGHELVSDRPRPGLKHALIGTVLRAGDPVRDALVGRAVPPARSVVRYLDTSDIDGMSTRERARSTVRAPAAFLATHHPDRWPLGEAEHAEDVASTAAGMIVRGQWSTGVRTSGIEPGDRVFLLRQGDGHRGIVGSGTYTSRIFPAGHWDGSGGTAHYAKIDWDVLLEPRDALPTAELQVRFPDQHWTPQSSGTAVMGGILDDLEAAWAAHVGRPPPRRAMGGGQGWQLDPVRRRKVEDAAQARLTAWYESEGWTVRDTRHGHPYDAVASKEDQIRYLEAKGTETTGASVLVTRGEVRHAEEHPGACVVGILSDVRFTPTGDVDPDSGTFRMVEWSPHPDELTPLTYTWTPPVTR